VLPCGCIVEVLRNLSVLCNMQLVLCWSPCLLAYDMRCAFVCVCQWEDGHAVVRVDAAILWSSFPCLKLPVEHRFVD
jgi:hypothetical protein